MAMAFSISSITGLFRRGKKAQDPFGGDDDEDFYDDDVFDGESEGKPLGRKIALGLSGLMAVLLVGFIATAIMTADESAGPVVSSLPTEIAQVVSEDGEVLQTLTPDPTSAAMPSEGTTAMPAPGVTALPAPGVTAMPGAGVTAMPGTSTTAMPSTEIIGDSTAETDRSASRRPWLRTETATGDRLNPQEAAPAAEVTPGRASSMADLLQQSRENRPAPVADVPSPIAMPGSESPTSEMADTAAMPSAVNEMDASVANTDDMQDIAGLPKEPMLPALADPGLVPGAPTRFAQGPDANTGPTQVGGAPRLVEPTLPPTDSRAVSAAPPRFTTLPKAEQLAQSATGAARIAIIVEGLGLNKTATEAAIDALPAGVTLAFSPYARDLESWLTKAQDAGHEVLIEVPMESKRFPASDPGPLGLLTSLDQIENADRLSAILEQAPGAAGILDVTGSRFRESAEHINIVMNNLDARGLFYVQGRPGLRLGNNRVASATTDMVLDERSFRASIDARLDYVERLAKYQGSSVAVTAAKPVTFERLALWLDEIGARGVAVAPVSEVLIQ